MQFLRNGGLIGFCYDSHSILILNKSSKNRNLGGLDLVFFILFLFELIKYYFAIYNVILETIFQKFNKG